MRDPLVVLRRAVDMYMRLTAAGIDCAMGDALALGYHVDDPRGTSDIDLNVSVPAGQARKVLELLPGDVPWTEETVAAIERDSQARLIWPDPDGVAIALDLFFMAGEFHEIVRTRTEVVEMLETQIRDLVRYRPNRLQSAVRPLQGMAGHRIHAHSARLDRRSGRGSRLGQSNRGE